MIELFARRRWRTQLDAIVQHLSDRMPKEHQMALDLTRLLDGQKKAADALMALVSIVKSLNDRVAALEAALAKATTPTTDPADQAAVDAAGDALAAAAAAAVPQSAPPTHDVAP